VIRAARESDAERAAALVIAGDIAEIGEADYSLGALHDEWAELDLAKDAAVEERDGELVGYAHFRGSDLLIAGETEALTMWAIERGTERGDAKLRQAVGHLADERRAALEAAGWHKERSYWRMVRDPQPTDAHDDFRAVTLEDGPMIHAIYEAAFSDTPDMEPATEAVWIQRHFHAHDANLGLSRVAENEGFALVRDYENDVAYVSLLAVRPDSAGKGLGSRILQAVFVAAQRQVVLNVASDNPNAVRLYERVGMRQGWRVDDYQLALPH
jgi:mycothiol synthase